MDQVLMINAMMESERVVTLSDDRRRFHRYEPYVNYLATPDRNRFDPRTFLDRVFGASDRGAIGRPGWTEELF